MIYLYGAGGHAKVVIDILESLEFEIGGIIDDNEELSEIMGYKVYKNDTLNSIDKKHIFLISIGNNKTRKDIAEKLDYKYIEQNILRTADENMAPKMIEYVESVRND